jgi:hypothetical protein
MYCLILVVISGKEENSRRKQEKYASRGQTRTLVTKKKGILIQNLYRVDIFKVIANGIYQNITHV